MRKVKKPEVGDPVVYHSPSGVPRNALVTAVFQRAEHDWLVNVVFVSGDPERQDSYGRQIERNTSTMHAAAAKVHGNYWRWPNEEPNPYQAPVSV